MDLKDIIQPIDKELDTLNEHFREAMRSNVPRFSTRRMVKQYVMEMYGPAARATVNSATE